VNGAWVTFKQGAADLLRESGQLDDRGGLLPAARGYELTFLAQWFGYFSAATPTCSRARRTTLAAARWLMVMLVPGILTMRCFAEERRTGSIETLMTAPVRDGAS
jgi:hypothetical protein